MLVRALVQRALQAPPGLVAGLDEAGARLGQLGARVRVGQRLGEQAAEPDEPALAAGRQRLLLGRRRRAATPQASPWRRIGAAIVTRSPTLFSTTGTSPLAPRS